MKVLTKRLQVLFPEKKYRALERVARTKKRSVGALIRQAVEAQYLKPQRTFGRSRVARIAKLNLPVSDWKVMKGEIMAGALGKRKP
jgi:hypothetical protein